MAPRTNLASRTPLWAVGVGAILHLTNGTRSRPYHSARGQTSRSAARPVEGAGVRALDAAGNPRNGPAAVRSGRAANSPSDIPAKGWKAILLRVFHGISGDRIIIVAAGVTFFVLLALFPGLAGLIALYGLFADAQSIAQHLELLSGILPEGGIQVLRDQILRLTSQPGKLGLALVIGLGLSLWSANGGMKAMFDALNVVYHEDEKRNFFKLNAISLTFTLGAILFVVLALAAMTLLPVFAGYVGLSRVMELVIKIGRWPVLILIVTFAIALLYRFGPSRAQPRWQWITPGSIFAAVGWLGASLLFSWYTENFGSYNETYGSLGAAIGFMTWLWISVVVILIGAKLNSEIEQQAEDA